VRDRLVAGALLGLLILAGTTCSASRSRCEKVCAREAECADKLEIPDTDVPECVEACQALETDETTRKMVDEHIRCVNNAKSCAAIIDCP
jgi:hypothetical protein